MLNERGFQRLVACALRENHAFEHLAKRAGFHVEQAEGATFRWVRALTAGEGAAGR